MTALRAIALTRAVMPALRAILRGFRPRYVFAKHCHRQPPSSPPRCPSRLRHTAGARPCPTRHCNETSNETHNLALSLCDVVMDETRQRVVRTSPPTGTTDGTPESIPPANVVRRRGQFWFSSTRGPSSATVRRRTGTCTASARAVSLATQAGSVANPAGRASAGDRAGFRTTA